jgi:flagellar biosynthesis component FlhA
MGKKSFSLNSVLAFFKGGNLLGLLSKHQDLIFPIVLLLGLATLFIPIPAELLSVLILISLSVSVMVLVTSLILIRQFN